MSADEEKRERRAVDPMTRRSTCYARAIRELREDHDLSQQAIADYLKVGQKTYGDYELSKTRIPVDRLIELARFYDVDMNYICGVTKKKAPFPGKRVNGDVSF